MLLLGVYFLGVALTGTVACLFRPFNPDNSRLCGNMFSWGAVRILGIKLIVEGQEHFENMRPGIVIANHQSNLDLFVHGAVIPRYTVSLGKKSLKYVPFFGQVYWLAGNILIDRGNRKESANTLSQVRDAIQKNGTSIWVFAEGTRNQGKGLLPFKKGAFRMAMQSEAPIYPICASTYAGRLDYSKWHSGTVIVRVLPIIETKNLDSEMMPELITNTHTIMGKEIDALDGRIAA